MLFYTFAQRIRHFIQAKNRHGVHSPFVFNFVEEVLKPEKQLVAKTYDAQMKNMLLTDRQITLIQSIASYYQCELIHHVPGDRDQNMKQGRLYLLSNNEDLNASWGEKDIVVLANIYQNKLKTRQWKHCVAQQKVSLSIDLFDVGLLFFSHDFKEKQHFILH